MAKRRYGCAYCPETFKTITEHMIHVSQGHPDRMALGRGGVRRAFSCRSCAATLPADAVGCECGWQVPPGMTAATALAPPT